MLHEPRDEEITRGAAAGRLAQVKARFAEIDAMNRSVDEGAPAPEELAAAPEADAAMDAFLDAIEHGDRP
ncbi:hypothetical protein [Streptomyces boninensis]|uniref:hypothetical protein n=1 Tax=Streptomyces boninensis TaxID=2039455 RepID=UPI003B219E4F